MGSMGNVGVCAGAPAPHEPQQGQRGAKAAGFWPGEPVLHAR